MPTAQEFIKAAKVRSGHKHPYFTSAIYAMRLQETPEVPTMGVDKDWNCYFNPETVLQWSVEEVSTVLEHEMWHLLRNHHERRPMVGPNQTELTPHQIKELWNVAGDCEINDDLQKTGTLPGDYCHPKKFNLKEGLLAEEYYDTIPPEKANKYFPGDQENPWGGSCADGVKRTWEKGGEHISPMEKELISKEVARKIKEHTASRGNMPAGMVRWADDQLREPIIPWNKELASILRGHLASLTGYGDITYARRHRRQSFYGTILRPAPYRLIPQIVVVVDTSGSVSDEMLSQALTEVHHILRANEGIGVTVMSCDAAVANVQKVFSRQQITFKGGGGTDMVAGIMVALEKKPQILILITDGFTPYPEAAPNDSTRFVTLVLAAEGAIPNYGKVVKYNGDALEQE